MIENAETDEAKRITPASDLGAPNRRICIVTTASVPWRTGTSINPLARALYLCRRADVTLFVPWLNQEDQSVLYGKDCTFETEEGHERWIRQYCIERVHCEDEAKRLKLRFYPAMFSRVFGSIFPTVDICSLIPSEEADIAILEEPEHLNWFRIPPEVDEEAPNAKEAGLGWKAKFRHVVGIVHTNYNAYLDQYSVGASFITASALGALSSLVVRAYCHRVIRLSDSLPVLDRPKELTCNVHGVRSEFFQQPSKCENDEENFSPIYFIGKLIWPKGFGFLLEVEDKYRDSTGAFFPIDVYGSGPNEIAIKRAFLGREGIIIDEQHNDSTTTVVESEIVSQKDEVASLIFSEPASLKEQVTGSSIGRRDASGINDLPNLMSVLEDVGGRAFDAGVTTTSATTKLGETLLSLGFHAAFLENQDTSSANGGQVERERQYHFNPAQTRFELRRQAVPARFLGVKDHATLRDIQAHKIFLNMSESEVLCTTTAEALAMGKFVIIPVHPSNEFFVQFSNCLAFSSQHDCVEKIKWALENDPNPLTPEETYKLTWEGAVDRLIKCSGVTESTMQERQDSGEEESDREAARLHFESMKNIHKLSGILP